MPRRTKPLLRDTRSGSCSYCGAEPGSACVVTLAPEVGPLSVSWAHRARGIAELVANTGVI